MREGQGTIRITKEEGVSNPDTSSSFIIPVFDLYECGLDANCANNICTLLDSDDVKCRFML